MTLRAPKPPDALPETLLPSDPNYGRERYTVTTAALYLSVGRDTVYREAAAGRLGYRRTTPAGELRFSQAHLDLWREARTSPARDAASRKVRAFPDPAPTARPLPVPRERRFP